MECLHKNTAITHIIATNGKEMLKETCSDCSKFIRFAPQPITVERALAFKFEVGKHLGKTLRQVKEHDPGYLKWIVEESTFKQNVKQMAKLVLSLST